MDGSVPMFRLTNRGGEGLCCDLRGVALGPLALIEAAEANGRRVYRVRPAEEIARTLALAYDPFTPDDLSRRLSGLDVAARSLETGDVAKAMVATVLLKLPPLSDEAIAKLACDPTLKKYSPDQPRDERGRWTTGEIGSADASNDAAAAKPVQVAANDTGVISDASGILPADKPATRDNPGVPVILPDGSQVRDDENNELLMSPVGDLSGVAAAGRETGKRYWELLANPATSSDADFVLLEELDLNLGHGGTFDYQREEGKYLLQFRDVSNFNVGLFCQQAGLTLDGTLKVAGLYARLFSRNSRSDQPYSLDPRQRKYIEMGYAAGARGMFGPAARPTSR